MVAGLCRVLSRKKSKVAPFKPQNMALNSAVTIDGGEIGRAQAVQAQACYLEPHSDFNPILLKPSSDTGAQVIVHGKVVSAMQAAQYHDYKQVAMQAVLESHARLEQQYQSIIVEGAGSPAEINLRDNDIANMGFAEAVDCPVVIIADIDRGGVFAHLVGTLDLLSKSEQDRVVGFIINRFRGDIALLENGLDWLEDRTGKPVLGVIPYLTNFFLDAEDAISTLQVERDGSSQAARFKVLVPVLPRISNHTDFDALRLHPQVDLQFVALDQTLPHADLIILPGSKNVLDDLAALKQAGWQSHLEQHCRYGGKVIGICGGYQMLGKALQDPHGIESKRQHDTGFGLLDIETVLEPEKQLVKAQGTFCHPNFEQRTSKEITGYEIHCGVSNTNNATPLFRLDSNRQDGLISPDNQVLGTYLHGVFDTPSACQNLLDWAGLKSNAEVDLNAVREEQLERLADCLEHHLDPAFLEALA